MKPKSKILSLLLAICLVVGLLPTTVFAAGDTGKAIQLGTSGIKDPTTKNDGGGKYYTPNSYIYFGKAGSAPIKWRVLDANADNTGSANGMFLLSEHLLGNTRFHGNSNVWQGSTAQSWCNTFVDNTSNFSTAEKNAMLGVAKTDSAENNLYILEWGESSLTANDKMFFLSVRELADYVGDYDCAPGLTATYGDNSPGYWCLRSPKADGTRYVGVVSRAGYVHDYHVNDDWAARPAFNLDLNSVLFTSAAEGGKISTGADAIFEIGDYTGNEWKLTVLDNSRNFAVTEKTASGKPGDTITLNYSGATTGTNEYISVIIADNSGAQYYGRVAQPTEASGQIQIKIPASLADGTYTLNVFSEQYNGGENDDTKLTDYASAFEAVTLTVSIDTTAPILSSGSATRDSETAATVKFTSDEAGTYYYVVVESGAAEPSIDTTGTGTVCASGENTISLNDLADAGAKDIYIVAKDASGNVSQPLKISIPAIYTLTVNLNGGDGITTDGKYIEGKKVSIDAGTKSGYRFAGWTSSNGGSFADASSASTTFTMPANDTTITANWKKKSSGGSVFFWDLKFDTNGGSKIDTVTEWEYSTIDLDEYVPEKEGYKFVGWYADKDFDKKIDEVYLTQDTTVYAKWEKIEEEVPEEPEGTEEIKEPETISFKDVKESDWFYDAVSYAVENGLMSGMSEDIFAPNTPLTREMLAVVLYNVEGQPESTGVNAFTDVKADMWYTDAILWANANGIVAGYDNGAYGVGDLITREQFATILYRYVQFKGYDTTQGGMAVREFSDYENISDYARPAMAWAVNAGIMGGMDDGTLMPQGKATRAEAATMLMNFCENVMK